MDIFLKILRIFKFTKALQSDINNPKASLEHTAFGILIFVIIVLCVILAFIAFVCNSIFVGLLGLALAGTLICDTLIKIFLGKYWIWEYQLVFLKKR